MSAWSNNHFKYRESAKNKHLPNT